MTTRAFCIWITEYCDVKRPCILKIISAFLVLFFISIHVAGQGLVDTPANRLLVQIQQSKSDTSRVKFLLALSKQLILKSGAGKPQIDSAYQFEKQAAQLSTQENDLKNWGKSILIAALIENKKGARDKGLLLTQQALSYFRQIDDFADQAEATIVVGQHYEPSDSNIDKIIGYYQTAVALFRRTNEKERLATTLVDLADFQQWNGNATESLKNLREALKIYKTIGYQRLTNVYGLIGKNLLKLGDTEDALKYGLLAERSAVLLGDSSLQLSTVYHRISECYRLIRNYKKAFVYSEKALAIANKYRDSNYITIITFLQARLYYANHEPQKSIIYLNKLNYRVDPNLIEDVVNVNSLYVKNYVDLKKFELAKTYLQKMPLHVKLKDDVESEILHVNLYYLLGIKNYGACYRFLKLNKQIIGRTKFPLAKINNELYWFKADSALGRYSDAIKHYQLSRKLSDSMFSIAKDKQLALLQIEYDTEQKEQQLLLQTKSIQLLKNKAQLESQKQNVRVSLLTGVLTISLLVLSFGYGRYRLKQRTNIILESKQIEINEQNILLQNLLTEKEWLLKEIHHRVKNNLQITMSLLSVQTRITTSQVAKEALLNGQRRLHSMSLIHQKLYQSEKLAFVEMASYINEMVIYLKNSFDNTNNITFRTQAENLELDVAQAVPLGLILNEAITNAIKYAFPEKRPGEVIIKLSADNNGLYQLTVADNGIGLTDSIANEETKSLGMELFKILSKQIDGELLIDGKNGTNVSVKFKALDLFM